MELEELIGKVVDHSAGKDKRVARNREYIVGTIMADIEFWPAWYFEMFDGEENFDFSNKTPTSLQKVDLSTLKKVFTGFADGYRGVGVPEFDSGAVGQAIAERVVYWADWYWDLAESTDLWESQQLDEVYGSGYGTQ